MNEMEKNSSEKVGPLIGSVIIILIIIMAAFYLFSLIKDRVETQKQIDTPIEENVANQSDEISDIEADVHSTEVENVDQDLKALEVEFQI